MDEWRMDGWGIERLERKSIYLFKLLSLRIQGNIFDLQVLIKETSSVGIIEQNRFLE